MVNGYIRNWFRLFTGIFTWSNKKPIGKILFITFLGLWLFSLSPWSNANELDLTAEPVSPYQDNSYASVHAIFTERAMGNIESDNYLSLYNYNDSLKFVGVYDYSCTVLSLNTIFSEINDYINGYKISGVWYPSENPRIVATAVYPNITNESECFFDGNYYKDGVYTEFNHRVSPTPYIGKVHFSYINRTTCPADYGLHTDNFCYPINYVNDDDNDGTPNDLDACPNDPLDECPEGDSDGDGFENGIDVCPNEAYTVECAFTTHETCQSKSFEMIGNVQIKGVKSNIDQTEGSQYMFDLYDKQTQIDGYCVSNFVSLDAEIPLTERAEDYYCSEMSFALLNKYITKESYSTLITHRNIFNEPYHLIPQPLSDHRCDTTILVDTDGDGLPDIYDQFPNDLDNDSCIDNIGFNEDGTPIIYDIDNTDPNVCLDSDGDGIPDSQDDDIDNDGIPNDIDNDADGDGLEKDVDPDDTNPDTDGDGVTDDKDTKPEEPLTGQDTDGDGIEDDRDPRPNNPDGLVGDECFYEGYVYYCDDTDGDGEPDTPKDTDGDGIPDDEPVEPECDETQDICVSDEDLGIDGEKTWESIFTNFTTEISDTNLWNSFEIVLNVDRNKDNLSVQDRATETTDENGDKVFDVKKASEVTFIEECHDITLPSLTVNISDQGISQTGDFNDSTLFSDGFVCSDWFDKLLLIVYSLVMLSTVWFIIRMFVRM